MNAVLRHAVGLSIAIAAGSGAGAQGSFISPVQAVVVEGNTNNDYPWITSMRYLQVHSDVSGNPRLLTKLQWRQDANGQLYLGQRTLDLELFMGPGRSWDQIRLQFADNYLAPRQPVITRKVVNLGPQGQSRLPGPNLFRDMDLLLDVPYSHSGQGSLIWDVSVHSSTLSGGTWNQSDAERGGIGGESQGVPTGPGCTASGQTQPMLLSIALGSNGGCLGSVFAVERGPALSPAVIVLGAVNLNLPIPGLCTTLQSDASITVPLGNTDAAGGVPVGGTGTFFARNQSPGAVVHVQAAAIDLNRSDAIKLSLSNGSVVQVPATGASNIVRVSRLYAIGQPYAALAQFAGSGVASFGLVTKFNY